MLETERDKFSNVGNHFEGELWCEQIDIIQNWNVLARFDSGLYKGYPAVISRDKDHGRFIHIATCPPATESFFAWLLSALHMLPVVTSADDLQAIPMQYKDRKFLSVINFSYEDTGFALQSSGAGLSAALGEDEQLVMHSLSAGETFALPARSFAFIELQETK